MATRRRRATTARCAIRGTATMWPVDPREAPAAAVAGRTLLRRAGIGYRRIDPSARRLLRHRRPEADLWSRQHARRGAALVVAGSRRAAVPHRGRRRASASADRRLRPARHEQPQPRRRPTTPTRLQQQKISTLRLGIPRAVFYEMLDPEIEQAVNEALAGPRSPHRLHRATSSCRPIKTLPGGRRRSVRLSCAVLHEDAGAVPADDAATAGRRGGV